MIVLQTIAVALSMYSALPMPQFAWDQRNMRCAMSAFPLVGVFCGAAVWLWAWLCGVLDFGPVLTGAGIALAPVVITGGIHLDGFCDTVDSLASHQDRERKLEILKDSHCGAFAVIATASYLVFLAALCSELPTDNRILLSLGLCFVLSRALSGTAVTTFPCAKNSGLVHTFSDMAAKKLSRTLLILVAIAASAGLVVLGSVWAVVAAMVMFGIYYALSMKIFGGITGDLAGWFLQWAELLMIFALVVTRESEVLL